MTTLDTSVSVGQLVADKPARSRVFQQLGIDFCCGGKKPLEEACRTKGLDPHTVLRMLLAEETETRDAGDPVDTTQMSLAELCDHIESTHHAYLRSELPRLQQMLMKVAAVHGDRHPWMRDVLEVYVPFCQELASHMLKEEQVLFPMIRGLETGRVCTAGHCGGTIGNPVRMMEHEHDDAGNALRRMHEFTDSYTPPDDACNTFRAALDGLRELEYDMHQHVHKENNILFPRALELEQKLSSATGRH